MDAKRFFEEAHRMCKKRDSCEDCPVRYNNIYCVFSRRPSNQETEEISRIIQSVEKWSQEHQKKTRLDDFLEKHPNAPMGEDGLPFLAPGSLGYCGDTPCYACKKAKDKPFAWCWDQEVEDDE